MDNPWSCCDALHKQVLLYTAPIYNLIMYIFIHAPIDVVIWILRGLDARLLVSGLTSLLGACRPIAGAFGDFVRANPYSCGDMTQLPNCTLVEDASVECTGTPGYLTAAHVCLDPGLRRIDLSGATTLMQSGLLDATRALGSLDPNLRRALNGLLYPITDTGTWTALQDILNAVLSAVWGVPTATMTRCSLSIPSRKSMCTPDVHPPFAALVSAFRTLGGVINRWVDMVYALIVYGEDVPCPASTDLSAVFADPIWSGLAGSNSTALVRMTSTSFAITDGTHVDYVDHTAQVCFCRLFGRPVVYILTLVL